MDLRELLNLCQGERDEEWIRIPGGGPGDRLPVGLIDVAFDKDPPALAVLHATYRAVYMPDPQLGIAWGVHDEDWREGNRGRQATDEKPEWAVLFDWTSAWQRWAHVLFNGAMVWQLSYAYINAGAGVDGILPWPRPVFSEDWQPGEGPELTGHETTRWEVEFARLLNGTQRNDAFGFDAALQALDWSVRDVPPISAELARW